MIAERPKRMIIWPRKEITEEPLQKRIEGRPFRKAHRESKADPICVTEMAKNPPPLSIVVLVILCKGQMRVSTSSSLPSVSNPSCHACSGLSTSAGAACPAHSRLAAVLWFVLFTHAAGYAEASCT
jgi:hypothetical protein